MISGRRCWWWWRRVTDTRCRPAPRFGGGDVADRIKLSPPPLDLTNKSPEPPTAGGNDDMAATAAAKLGLENHLNLLKMKEMEMMKTVPVNRCVFSAKQPLQFFLSVRML